MAEPARPVRAAGLDIARGVLLLGMILFHLVLDLEMFGLLAPGTSRLVGWALLARLVAGGFLFVAGISLWLAHGQGFRPRPFLRRLAVIAGAALLVTLATRLAMPAAFVYFGILHAIAAASLVGLVFLRAPPWLCLAAAAAAASLPFLPGVPVLNQPWLLWLGLAQIHPPSMDYVPLLPWSAPLLAGLALARLVRPRGVAARPSGPLMRALGWPGRHSLIIYLVHQPVLIGLIWTAARAGLI